jgi:hypothetical protein
LPSEDISKTDARQDRVSRVKAQMKVFEVRAAKVQKVEPM